nr:neurofascin-like [Procambarus clarkii]
MYRGHRHSASILSSGSEVPPLPLTSPPHTPAFPTDEEEEEITEYDNELRRSEAGHEEEVVEEGIARQPPPPGLTLSLASPSALLPPATHHPAELVSPVNVYKASVLMVPVATERLIGSGTTTTTTTSTTTTTTTSSSTTTTTTRSKPPSAHTAAQGKVLASRCSVVELLSANHMTRCVLKHSC